MKRILYIKPVDRAFILFDQRLLEKHFNVKHFLLNRDRGGFYFLYKIIRLFFFLLFNARGSMAMVTWFGDYHAAIMTFIGNLFNIKVVIFVGGQETICYPELKKGVFRTRFRAGVVRYALKNASLIIPNHQSLIYHENYYYNNKGKKDGIKYYIPDIKTRIEIIPNGINTEKFFRDSTIPKDDHMVLTVGTMTSIYDFMNKGFDLFFEIAARNKDLNFILIGIKAQFMDWVEMNYHPSKIENLLLVPSFCPFSVLFEYYNKAKVFVQASITEGMPNTINEAMLCECIPVGSNVNGIPDAMGGNGVILNSRLATELEKAVRKALTMNSGYSARQHVLENYTYKLREERLITLLKEILAVGI